MSKEIAFDSSDWSIILKKCITKYLSLFLLMNLVINNYEYKIIIFNSSNYFLG